MHHISVTGQTAGFFPFPEIPGKIKMKAYENTFVFSSESPEELELFKNKLINSIANFIEHGYKDALVKRELSYMNGFTKEDVLFASDFVNNHCALSEFKIKEKLKSFFTDFSDLSLEGFVNFRLKSFKDEIKRLCDAAADILLAEKEYNGFLTLLSEYIALKPPLFDILHIVITRFGGYYVFDGNQSDITEECANAVAEAVMADEICFDDIILCFLILASPEKTVIHGANHIKSACIVETLRSILGDSVEFCSGCALCSKYI